MILSALILAGSVVLFLIGMQLSAFFSGSETGFYRVSHLQLALQQQQGDAVARRLGTFLRHPERFVSTTLVGNNVANYLTTIAIGLFVAEMSVWAETSGGAEITATLIMTPVVFVFGELIPKSLYYRAPLSLLRSKSGMFLLFYFLFLPISLPLTLLASAMLRVTGRDRPAVDFLFSRTRLFGLIAAGKREGVITQIQGRMADNLMTSARRSIASLMESPVSVPGVSELADRQLVLSVADQTRTGYVLLHPPEQPGQWTRCVRAASLLLSRQSVRSTADLLPRFDEQISPLVALAELFDRHAVCGVVVRQQAVIGIVRRSVLCDQLLTAQTTGGRNTAWEP